MKLKRPIGLSQQKRKFKRSEIRNAVRKHEQMKLNAERLARESAAVPFKILL